MQNNNSFGIWKTEKDTLIIFFDSIKNQHNKFKGELILFGSEKFKNWEKIINYLC
jgi:hypothetical protein